MKHLGAVVATLLVASFVFHAALYVLAIRGVDPVIYVAAAHRQAGVYPHPELRLSVGGAAMWILLTALFSIIAGSLLARTAAWPFWHFAALLFPLTVAYLFLVHPTLIWEVLPPPSRSGLTLFLRDYAKPLYVYYFGVAGYRIRPFLPVLHTLLMSLLLLPGRRSAEKSRWDHE